MKLVDAVADTIITCSQSADKQMVVKVGAEGISILLGNGEGGYSELDLSYDEWASLVKELGEGFPPPSPSE